MKERPIVFSTVMIKAILEGRKTQTRRVVTPSTSEVGVGKVDWSKFCWDSSQIYLDTCQHGHTERHKAPLPFIDGRRSELSPYEHQYLHVPYNWQDDRTIFRIYPKWEVGDRLWVRETFCEYTTGGVIYRADEKPCEGVYSYHTWKPSTFMPRWASRITLEITEVRVERLQEISHDDVIAEGLSNAVNSDYFFPKVWDSLNAKRGYGWETNCWVWVIGFKEMPG